MERKKTHVNLNRETVIDLGPRHTDCPKCCFDSDAINHQIKFIKKKKKTKVFSSGPCGSVLLLVLLLFILIGPQLGYHDDDEDWDRLSWCGQ